MLSSPGQHQSFPDGTIRRFLLAQLSANEQSAFEAALFTDSQLEQRVRLAEIELIDDYAADRLRVNERAAFHEKFFVTPGRQKKLEVSNAFRKSLAADVSAPAHSSAKQLFNWPRLGWRIGFALVALIFLFASALVIRREPQLVKRIIPKRFRPVAVASPAPQAAHHSANSSGSAGHLDESTPLPAHEAAPQMIVLRPGVAADNPTVLTRAENKSNVLRLQLTLERTESATFSIVVTTSNGEVVHKVPEIHVENLDRIDFDVQVDRLGAGDFQVTLTRITGEAGVVANYYFRVP